MPATVWVIFQNLVSINKNSKEECLTRTCSMICGEIKGFCHSLTELHNWLEVIPRVAGSFQNGVNNSKFIWLPVIFYNNEKHT